MELETKGSKVREFVRRGEYKQALKIAKGFNREVSKEESEAMRLAYECMNNPRFYEQLGKDIQASIEAGIAVLKKRFA